jgi:hypothetical protein
MQILRMNGETKGTTQISQMTAIRQVTIASQIQCCFCNELLLNSGLK